MVFEKRKQLAIQLASEKGIAEKRCTSPLHRWFWRKGIKIPPPLFAPLWLNTLLSGTLFGLFWGILMWLISWRAQGTDPRIAVFSAVLAGVLYGLCMALMQYRQRKKHNLPGWKEIN
ncbi:DUF6404 family protein [Kalamiella sp. sgz302252]|uniref:DUF6404 family protein n=1 Tax=Pantoea sp. sgz302252 TaxID=3341827 RepID=UPI0036D2372C